MLTSPGVALLAGSSLAYRRRTETKGILLGTDRNQAPVIFNIFDRANFANPGSNVNSASSLGLITATRNGNSAPGIGFGEPRNVQLALKLLF